MCKKIIAATLLFVIVIFCGCSKEKKIGVEQFVDRMNEQFEYNLNTSDFILGTDESKNNNLFRDSGDSLISLSLDNDNNIKGVSLLFTDEESTSTYMNYFFEMCSVFTGDDLDSQKAVFESCNITADTIKFADNNKIITVGKYKYTVVCNQYSVTLFCDKI